MATAIWWIRRDLRLTDNQALTAALTRAAQIVPCFVLDPRLLNSSYAGERRKAFLFSGLRVLDADLRRRGGRLIVRCGDPAAVLSRLAAESGACAVYAERDYSPYARCRDEAVARALPIPLVLTDGLTIRRPDALLKDDGTPYTVFTPYSRRWRSHPPVSSHEILPAPNTLAVPESIVGEPIPEQPRLDDAGPFPAGEAEAQARLRRFTTGDEAPIYAYAQARDFPDLDSTSKLSPYLRFGMLSARQAALAAYQAMDAAANAEQRTGAETWLTELIWRDFYYSILYHFPHVARGCFQRAYDAIIWENNPTHFAAWCAGLTGYPFIDAAMRQLAATGWMHNRARMAVASFLVKDLLIDWRWGEKWFMQMLLDGDLAANNGGWQWSAGVGTDAAPYFRIFNPTAQGQKFDPRGVYIRRWVPELRLVPDRYIHEPWRMPRSEQMRAGCIIGQNYPAPIVDHAVARQRVLEAYRRVRVP
jgi:deoxyribodipyrimidine photo-lyase